MGALCRNGRPLITTNSYLEFFLTLLGWIINNGIWNLLIATGLFALPLVLKVVGIWLKVREEGDDEGNKAAHRERALQRVFCDVGLLPADHQRQSGQHSIR